MDPGMFSCTSLFLDNGSVCHACFLKIETAESDVYYYESEQAEQLASDSPVVESTVNDHEPANTMHMVTSPPPVVAVSPPLIYRTSSMPGGLEDTVHSSSPVQLRLTTSRSRKKAQYLRNSVAVTNSDYLNQWRPQMMKLLQLQSPTGSAGSIRTVPSLDTISEHELSATFQPTLSPLISNRQQQQADPNMFRYTPTPILDPARQTIPRPPSRPTTPVPPSSVLSSRTTTPMLTPSIPALQVDSRHPFQVLRESSQAVRLSSDDENQFLPVFINPESGVVYMFEDGYYVPLAPQQVQRTAEDSNKATVTQPPAPVSITIIVATNCYTYVCITLLSIHN